MAGHSLAPPHWGLYRQSAFRQSIGDQSESMLQKDMCIPRPLQVYISLQTPKIFKELAHATLIEIKVRHSPILHSCWHFYLHTVPCNATVGAGVRGGGVVAALWGRYCRESYCNIILGSMVVLQPLSTYRAKKQFCSSILRNHAPSTRGARYGGGVEGGGGNRSPSFNIKEELLSALTKWKE